MSPAVAVCAVIYAAGFWLTYQSAWRAVGEHWGRCVAAGVLWPVVWVAALAVRAVEG